MRDIIQNINIQKVENAAIGGKHATAQQNAPSAEMADLLQLLKQILEQSDANNPDHEQLRADVNAIIKVGDRGEKPPKEGKKWLEDAKAGANMGGQLVNTLSKVVDLWDKIPGPWNNLGPGA